MEKERVFLSVEQAQATLSNGETVHVFLNAGGMLVGADWARTEIDKLLASATTIEIGGQQCISIGHGLVVLADGKYHFVESNIGKEAPDASERK